MSDKLQRRLFHIYSVGSLLGFATKQRVSSLGWLLLVGVPSVGFMCLIYPRDTLFRLFGILAALIIVAFFAALSRRAKLRVNRHMPAYGTVGETIEYTVECANSGRFTLANYYLQDLAPDPRPSKPLFLNGREPGEELRNGFDRRYLAYRWMWMTRRRLLFKSKPMMGETLAVGAKGTMRLQFSPLRRGVIQMERMQVILPDPMGVFQRVSRAEQESDTLIVLPKRYAFDGVNFQGQSRNQLGGDSTSSLAGQSGEFVSLREYRPGDPPKHIHWPSWGKAGKPIIKEYEDIFFPRYGLILDTAVKAEQEDIFEEAISIAATFVCSLDTEQALLDLMFVQQGARVVTVGKNVERVDKMLEVLAGLEMESQPDWEALRKMVLSHADALTTCIVVLCDWNDERAHLVNRLAASGVQLCVLLVIDGENEPVLVEDSSVSIVQIKVGQAEAGLSALARF
ncbi:DUF58 domain-containing protein [Rubritalea profundi]|uniref:Uncharacterized protein n=1 Tax=Rubritalea profundi TaxID=1658618 RepID=A0A2S7TWH5_9BACT|nr:DUF58 domain-containing protein [Rubritalea profundi]PQJ27078.1 hypothetical protein BSZ32_00210 [Rubritalea profundi]